MNNKFVYTAGPTMVKENVRLKRAEATTNPDVDLDFLEFYKKTTLKISKIINSDNDSYILSGEGILGLEAAVASLTEPGDRVLVIDNGIFGSGFGDFVSIYGGEVTKFSKEHENSININELENFLKNDHNFKYATIVHCDTPTGVLNDLSRICPLLKSYGILTVVDSVSAIGGELVETDKWAIDILLGASQKALSASSGLTIVTISDKAKEVMKCRKEPIRSFYCNLTIWEDYYEKKWFPYTMPISDIIELDKALDNILEEGMENVLKRHEKIAKAVRISVKEFGLELFLESGYSNTVTAIKIPKDLGAINLKNILKEKYNAIFSTSLNQYENLILRIGHMGENANINEITTALNLIELGLKDLGFNKNCSLTELFFKNLI